MLAHQPRLRVIYKPHPLTGTRDPRATRAHQQIVALIEQVNRQQDAGGSGPPEQGEPGRLAAAADLSRIGAQLNGLAGGAPAQGWAAWLRPQADAATLSRDSRPGTDGGLSTDAGSVVALTAGLEAPELLGGVAVSNALTV